MARLRLTAGAQRLIAGAVDDLFERARARFLGLDAARRLGGKRLEFSFVPELTLGGLFGAASREEGVRPNDDLLRGLVKIAGTYLDAVREKTKARTLRVVQSFLSDAEAKGVATDVKTVLGGELARVWGEVGGEVRRIVETETTVARNTSIYDAIGRIGAAANLDDPTVFFVTVRDKHRCPECTRLHLLEDAVTPRLWKQSELGAGYHKRGDDNPKVGGLHPHCRCVLTVLMPGYGFNKAGMVAYIAPGHDELAVQRGVEKSEADYGEPLQKGFKQHHVMAMLGQYGWQKKDDGKHITMEHPVIGAKVPFQHGYSGDYDLPWVKEHLAEAGLKFDHRSQKAVPNPAHPFYPHYVRMGHAALPQQGPQVRSWEAQGAEGKLPVGSVELGDNFDGAAHAAAVVKMKSGNIADLPALDVMDIGGGSYGTLSNHHLLQAARDAGMTHVPVRMVKSEARLRRPRRPAPLPT